MKAIVKNHATEANGIIDNYLIIASRQIWFKFGQLYDNFSNFPHKNRLMQSILLPEQDCLCCYCQRRLNRSSRSIEHIIPQETQDAASMERYFLFGYPGLNACNICHSSDYVKGNYNMGQYPHEVAYYNFVMACNECNSTRGRKFVDPIYLDEAKTNDVIYIRQTGEVIWQTDPVLTNPNSKEVPNLEKIKLNTPLLKAIRAVWLYGKDHPTDRYSTPDTIQNVQDRSELVYRTLGAAMGSDPNFGKADFNAYNELLKDGIWQRVLEYDYFGTI